MRIVCAPSSFDFEAGSGDLNVELYARSDDESVGSAGAAIRETIVRRKLQHDPRAWDFLSIALSAVSADLAGHRSASSDGWTREFDMTVSVSDSKFWNSQKVTLETALRFLSNDRWSFTFVPGGDLLEISKPAAPPTEDCALLLSGGLDSFVGLLDLTAQGKRPMVVSQSVRGDAEKQRELISVLERPLSHLQLNHNASVPNPEEPPSQRARSIIFFAYGVLAATTLANYRAGEEIILYVCENGFITINPPLTDARLGSLSTRTCNPVLISLLQTVLDEAGLRVRIVDPYRLKTKGEMLKECASQAALIANAYKTTSCGRFSRYGYRHCGKCIPCLIRRAAFRLWGVTDKTEYVFEDLAASRTDPERFDDVRSVGLALAAIDDEGLERWLGATLVSPLIPDKIGVGAVIERGLRELKELLASYGLQ